ncbi:DUF4386 domain-containing protein [Palleronia sp. KMU-117]|uniref:DUF4386 domain-containing protein n=1 Tax=Palleronia sp. KMU-117 TaxID=3434108 RepID=UPI003D720DB0
MHTHLITRTARAAGALYAVIIAAGIWSELGVRARLIQPGDAEATWAAIGAHLPLLRASIAADAVMLLADVALSVLLFALLRHVHREVALTAMVLRLIQAAIIGASLLAPIGVVLLANADVTDPARSALFLMELHGAGYDFGLIFFGVNTVLTAWLLCRSGLVPVWLAGLLGGAGLVYLAGSFTRLLAPEVNALLQPAYALPLLAETAFCIALLAGLPRHRAAPRAA